MGTRLGTPGPHGFRLGWRRISPLEELADAQDKYDRASEPHMRP
jgi:hypothetical protein